MAGKNKKKINYDLKVGEALEIKKANCGPGRGLNEDWGAYVKTDAWNPVFNTMDWQRMLLGGAGAQLLLSSLFSLSLQSPIVSLSPINSCLSLPLSASDDVSQSGFENLGKLMFCICTVLSIMRLQVIVLGFVKMLISNVRNEMIRYEGMKIFCWLWADLRHSLVRFCKV